MGFCMSGKTRGVAPSLAAPALTKRVCVVFHPTEGLVWSDGVHRFIITAEGKQSQLAANRVSS